MAKAQRGPQSPGGAATLKAGLSARHTSRDRRTLSASCSEFWYEVAAHLNVQNVLLFPDLNF